MQISDFSNMAAVKLGLCKHLAEHAREQKWTQRAAAERFGIPLSKTNSVINYSEQRGQGVSLEKLLEICEHTGLAPITLQIGDDDTLMPSQRLSGQVWRLDGQKRLAELLDWKMSEPAWMRKHDIQILHRREDRRARWPELADYYERLTISNLEHLWPAVSIALSMMLDVGRKTEATEQVQQKLCDLINQTSGVNDEYLKLSSAQNLMTHAQSILGNAPPTYE